MVNNNCDTWVMDVLDAILAGDNKRREEVDLDIWVPALQKSNLEGKNLIQEVIKR